KNEQVEQFLAKESQCQDCYQFLRHLIFNETELEENYKWVHPCYTINNKNVVLIHGFKDYVALLFQKGAILEDKYETLIQQTKRVQAARQLRFNCLDEIKKRQDEIKYYLIEAIKAEKAGKKVVMKKNDDEVPEELQRKFEKFPHLKDAFYQLTPGRQHQYLYYFSQAKRSQIGHNRIEKYIDSILNGKGMNDK
ncbi:hypothetical protein CD145_10275, partial [Staphylococcus saccharolyticus]